MKHILFVDDELPLHKIIELTYRDLIKEKVIKLHYGEDFESAISILNSDIGEEIKAVFTDINMPGKSGFDLLTYIKTNFPDKKVYMITGYDIGEYVECAQSLGCDGYFAKPLNFKEIQEKFWLVSEI